MSHQWGDEFLLSEIERIEESAHMVLCSRSTIPLVCGDLAFVRVWSMSSKARYSSYIEVRI